MQSHRPCEPGGLTILQWSKQMLSTEVGLCSLIEKPQGSTNWGHAKLEMKINI